jgi:hypothetical protein
MVLRSLLLLLLLGLRKLEAKFGDAEGAQTLMTLLDNHAHDTELTIDKIAARFKQRFKSPAEITDEDGDPLFEFIDKMQAQMRQQHLQHGHFQCKLPAIDKNADTQMMRAQYLKPRKPFVVFNAATPRDISWFADQECLGRTTTHFSPRPKNAFWKQYVKQVDPHHNPKNILLNTSTYFRWLNGTVGNQRPDKVGKLHGSGDVEYYIELHFMLTCPHLVKEWAVPEFMRDNWEHALQIVCSEIEDLPDMKIGPKGTGATTHLDSMHAEAYSLQLHGRKLWVLGDYYEMLHGNFSSLCMHVVKPGNLIHGEFRLHVHH